jgi:hypothetical protein
VTTGALFDNWLRAHKNSQSGRENLPEPVDAALKSNAFYTQALNTDAAFSRYAVLPITKPAQATSAFAMLGARSQDIGPRTPDEIVVSVVNADRLFVVTAPATAKVKPMPTCMAVWRESERRSKCSRPTRLQIRRIRSCSTNTRERRRKAMMRFAGATPRMPAATHCSRR